MKSAEQTDAFLIDRVLSGEVNCFASLVERYEKLVFSYLLSRTCSNDIEDIVQETFLKAYRHLGTFDRTRKFSAWLLAIARNVMIDVHRKNAKDVPSDDIVMDVLSAESENQDGDQPAEAVLRLERFKLIRKVIDSLSDEFKTPFLLRIINEMSYQDIADALELPLQTVKNRIFRARTVLREKSEKFDEM